MADIIDAAQEQSDQILSLEIQAQLQAPITKVEALGECHNCYEEVEHPKLFCDGYCAGEYERKSKLR